MKKRIPSMAKYVAKIFQVGKLFLPAPLIGVLLGIAATATILQADESLDNSEARAKLLSMLTGDIIQSLAVQSPAASPSTMASFPDSSVYAMGASTWGQLGIGTSSDTNVPTQLPSGFGGPIAVGSSHSLITDSEGTLWFTGNDSSGQLGDGPSSSSTTTFTKSAITGIQAVAAGAYHSLILADDGTVKASGEGSNGQLGNGGTNTDTFSTVNVSDAERISSYGNNSFVVTDQGELWAFGENLNGELGTGVAGSPALTPQKVISGGVTDVAAGMLHTLALMADGSVMAMGLNNYGQFGDGTTDSSTIPLQVMPPGMVKAIAAGAGFSLFLMADGSLNGVGLNSYGQMGTGDTAVHSTFYQIAAGGVSDIAAGSGHSLYVTDSGTLMGAGNNSNGQLGLGDFSPRLTHGIIEASGVVDVSADYNSTFFQKTSISSLEIRGLNQVYEGATANFECYTHWADGTTTDVTAKVFWSEDSESATLDINSGVLHLDPGSAPDTITITARYFEMMATRDISVVKVPLGYTLSGWGRNSYSQLGLDTIVNQLTHRDITDDRVISLAAGMNHSLYIREDGAVFAMGDNTYGQLGTSDTVPRTIPAQVDISGPAIAVSAGDDHSLVILRDGSLWAMGRNDEGQLGDGTEDNQSRPTNIWPTGVTQAEGGAGHSVFLLADGTVLTQGRNLEGQLGDGGTSGSLLPAPVLSAPATVRAIDAGSYYTVFVDDYNDLYGMGSNADGQLGLISSIVTQSTPTPLATDVSDITAGAYHTMYTSTGLQLYGTGRNTSGQLGDGSNADRYGFQEVSGTTDVTRVVAGGSFTLFQSGIDTLTDNGVDSADWYGMGDNNYGEFGNGTTTSTNTPTPLSMLTPGIASIAAGSGQYGGHIIASPRVLPGDIDLDGKITIADTILALQILAGLDPNFTIYGDVGEDLKIGMDEVIYTLQKQ